MHLAQDLTGGVCTELVIQKQGTQHCMHTQECVGVWGWCCVGTGVSWCVVAHQFAVQDCLEGLRESLLGKSQFVLRK